MLLNPFIIITFVLFCSMTIPYLQMPAFWCAWLFQLDPFTQLVGSMVVTGLRGRYMACYPGGLNYFNAPSGQTCSKYISGFFASGGAGYVVDNTTNACSYCAYKLGDQFYTVLGFEYDNR